MKASELRIGNLVYSQTEVENGNHLPVLVIGVDTNHVTYLSQNHRIHSEIRPFQAGVNQIYPIPLTAIWLESVRFGINHNFSDPDANEIYYSYEDFYVLEVDGVFTYNETILQHFHQLQNLHFAVTGEELIIGRKIR